MKLLLFIIYFGGVYGSNCIRPYNPFTGMEFGNIQKAQEIELKRAEREKKISHVEKILAKGNPINKQKAPVYVDEAEKNNIPYWLLPAISVLESSGCRNFPQRTNNCWGWGGDRLVSFPSLDVGIAHVSRQLGSGRYYANKTLYQKVTTYNSVNPKYYQNLLSVRGNL